MSEDGTNVGHLYVHLPFCSHRCGYCDFVTVVGRQEQHGAYVDALLVELERQRGVLSGDVATVFVGGGTPSFTDPDALRRVLASLPAAAEISVEANPETVTPELVELAPQHRAACHVAAADAGLGELAVVAGGTS